MFTDPISDMLTRIRNAAAVQKDTVIIPYSKMKHSLADVLSKEGFIGAVTVEGTTAPTKTLRVALKYVGGEGVIVGIKRVSKPGQRIYAPVDDIPRANGGMGITVLSTPKGIMSDREARRQKAGGEVICQIW